MHIELEPDPEKPALTDKEIFTKIWTSPREVFRFLNDNHYDKFVGVLLIFAGISRAFDRASMKNVGDDMQLAGILASSIVVGGLLGWISYYIYAALISWTGNWLEAKGNTKSILRALSHAMLPSILALLLLIPQIAVYGNEVFKEDGDISSGGLLSTILVYGSMGVQFILAIWTIVLCVIGVAEVQKLSIGYTIFNLILPALLLVGVIAVFAFFFTLF